MSFLPPDSALERSRNPKAWHWRTETDILANLHDILEYYVWAQSEDAQEGGEPPDGYPRPDFDDADEEDAEDVQSQYDDVLAWLEERNGHREIRGLQAP